MTTRFTRPWRITYHWTDTGRKGTINKASASEAVHARAEILRAMERRGGTLEITVYHRDTGETIPMPGKCIRCADRHADPFHYEYDAAAQYCRDCGNAVLEEASERRDFVADVHRLVDKARELGTLLTAGDGYTGRAGEYTVTVTRVPPRDSDTFVTYELSALTAGRDPITVTSHSFMAGGVPHTVPADELYTALHDSIKIPEGLTL